MPTCDRVLSESCLTLVSGTSHLDGGVVLRIGFTLLGSSRLFLPRLLMALACAASRSFLLSVRHLIQLVTSQKYEALKLQLTD